MYSTSHRRPKHDPARPTLFLPHPNFSDAINRNICRSEIEGGVFLDDLDVGTALQLETQNRFYELEYCGDGQMLIRGHPEFCPQSVLVEIHGSTWGGAMLKMGFIGRGMHLEFRHPSHGIIHTSLIQEIRESTPAGRSQLPSRRSAVCRPPDVPVSGASGLSNTSTIANRDQADLAA